MSGRVGAMAHQPQRLTDALIRDQAEERRLLQLHRQTLPQGVVEHRVAGGVHEIGETSVAVSVRSGGGRRR